MKTRVQRTITQHELLRQEGLVLVALSGGADSVALLLVLQELGYSLHALHCNFHLRAEESDRDEQFVRDLCRERSIPLSVRHFDTLTYAREKKVSIEMAARELRYAWFQEQIEAQEAQAICVAHHRSDQAETILLNLIRGTGLRGLAGMRYRNGKVCRPLLDCTKAEILEFLEENHQTYVTDSTNFLREARRNQIRLDILPALAQLNPNIEGALCSLAQHAQETLQLLPNLRAGAVSESPFTIQQATLTHLYEWTLGCHFHRQQLQEVLQAHTGTLIESPSHRLLRDRSRFYLQPKDYVPQEPTIQMQRISVSELPPLQRGTAYLDAALVELPIRLRRVENSDRFSPFGMQGRRLVSDYLTDLKLNRFEKEAQYVAVDARGRILWIVGYASDNRFRITTATKEVLILRATS